MNFPLHLSFKILALAPQITVTDANGTNICYVRQKIMKLRESIEVFTDKTKSEKICDIKSNKILDFSATYQFFDAAGQPFGAVARKGMKSLWKAHYDILDNDSPKMTIQEEKPVIKLLDGLVAEIPIVGGFAGFFLNPSYIIKNTESGKDLVRVQKRPAFFESKFTIDKLDAFDPDEEMKIVVSTLMMVLLEKDRG